MGDREARQPIEAPIAIAQVDVVQVRFLHRMFGPMLDSIQAFRLRYIQRPQDQAIQHSKHHGIRTNRDGQGQNRHRREGRGLSQHAKAEAKILHENVEEIAGHLLAGLFFESFISAKLDPRAPNSLDAAHPRSFQIIGAELDMRLEFFVHFGPGPGSPKDPRRERAKVGRQSHTRTLLKRLGVYRNPP